MKLWHPAYFTPAIHSAIWCLLLSIPAILFDAPSYHGLTKGFFLTSTLFHIGLFYLNAYVLYPRLATKKLWPLYVPVLAAVVVLSFRLKLYLLSLDAGFELDVTNRKIIFFGPAPFIIASILYRLVTDRLKFQRKEKEARAERLATELKFFRSQISPHFLFNMMTNMVALARQKSDLLEPSLIKLSELLRYMLYDSKEEKIPLTLEIDHLENYISLQQLRFADDVKVQTSISNTCDGCLVEPMLLIPFVENAFKHGIGMVSDPFIAISLDTQGYELIFTVKNNFNPSNHSKDRSSGIGLVNVKNRLELLYKGKYDLRVRSENDIFSIQLTLDLS